MKKVLISLICIFIVHPFINGQIHTTFYFSQSGFKTPIKTQIVIFSADCKKELYNDTTSKSSFSNDQLLKYNQEYVLLVKYYSSETEDSIAYNISTNNENTISIFVSLSQELHKRKVRVTSGYIGIKKILNGSENLKLEPINVPKVGSQVVLNLTNRTHDTISGEYIPGYFWGNIKYPIDSTNWTSYYGGQIDLNFDYREPLAPDSTTYTYVGSFGDHKYLKSGVCKYKLLYSTSDSERKRNYFEIKSNMTNWRAETDVYYSIEKDIVVNN